MRRWLRSDVAVLLWRIALVYVVLALCRLAFLIYNFPEIGHVGFAASGRLLRGAAVFDTASVIYADALFIVLSLLPLRIRGSRAYRAMLYWLYVGVNSVVVAVSLSDAVYYRYTHKRFTAEEIFFADNDNTLRLVIQFAAENWYLLLFGVLLIFMLARLYGRRIVPETPVGNAPLYYAFSTAVLCAAAVLCVGGVRGGFSRMTRPLTLSNATQWAATPAQANLILSNPFCIVRTFSRGGVGGGREYFGREKLDSVFTPLHCPVDTAGGMQRGKNVIIFVMESFSAEHSAFLNPDLYPDGGGYTPFLDSLMRSGYTFTRAYANGHKSIEALPSVLGSIPSFKTPFVLMPQSIGRSRQLPAILSASDYTTMFFCGSSRGSMGFEAYMRAAGVEHVFGKEDYEQVHGRGDFDGYWGIWDHRFMDYMGEVLGTMPQPFLSTVFTISSHHPFIVPDAYADRLPQGRTKIHRGISYTDTAIREFFDRYGSEPWFSRTLFVFVADHVSSEKWAPKTMTEIGRNHIIEFLYTPDGSLRGLDSSTVQQTDLMPTLLGLLGNTEPYFAFGRDVFNEPERTPFALKYSNGYYYAVTDTLSAVFDENDITAVYSLGDTLLRHNLLPDLSSPAVLVPLEERIKAVIQQYYDRVKRQDYTVGETN